MPAATGAPTPSTAIAIPIPEGKLAHNHHPAATTNTKKTKLSSRGFRRKLTGYVKSFPEKSVSKQDPTAVDRLVPCKAPDGLVAAKPLAPAAAGGENLNHHSPGGVVNLDTDMGGEMDMLEEEGDQKSDTSTASDSNEPAEGEEDDGNDQVEDDDDDDANPGSSFSDDDGIGPFSLPDDMLAPRRASTTTLAIPSAMRRPTPSINTTTKHRRRNSTGSLGKSPDESGDASFMESARSLPTAASAAVPPTPANTPTSAQLSSHPSLSSTQLLAIRNMLESVVTPATPINSKSVHWAPQVDVYTADEWVRQLHAYRKARKRLNNRWKITNLFGTTV
ncbi:hypothetical protein DFJ77DRAFT_475124 [Powellomyces hirtus]|nr:hypothetical protein DFJ77DRAFT_475124 [Powellomyces hirtus]